ncbi:DUF6194 family protein [Psychrobacter sp. M13]|uniref:DUF6194 family protein n=1 Tax=Psychrobacter sp. M13 TaxID=3067275 RepID=UPI00273BE5F9|nr:DUF6194 family protein [Psychrobacter sp. M13]WLP93817.1 DUF6194 family protein [Psychrobacter sp. M13]
MQNFGGVKPKTSWGETSLFYNPDNILPNGVYFCTIKEQDGDNDSASNLNRESVFRLSLGVGKEVYIEVFGATPKRPAKGETVDIEQDFSQLNLLMPHPIYAWMGWICINSPTNDSFAKMTKYIELSYNRAVKSYLKNKKVIEHNQRTRI